MRFIDWCKGTRERAFEKCATLYEVMHFTSPERGVDIKLRREDGKVMYLNFTFGEAKALKEEIEKYLEMCAKVYPGHNLYDPRKE